MVKYTKKNIRGRKFRSRKHRGGDNQFPGLDQSKIQSAIETTQGILTQLQTLEQTVQPTPYDVGNSPVQGLPVNNDISDSSSSAPTTNFDDMSIPDVDQSELEQMRQNYASENPNNMTGNVAPVSAPLPTNKFKSSVNAIRASNQFSNNLNSNQPVVAPAQESQPDIAPVQETQIPSVSSNENIMQPENVVENDNNLGSDQINPNVDNNPADLNQPPPLVTQNNVDNSQTSSSEETQDDTSNSNQQQSNAQNTFPQETVFLTLSNGKQVTKGDLMNALNKFIKNNRNNKKVSGLVGVYTNLRKRVVNAKTEADIASIQSTYNKSGNNLFKENTTGGKRTKKSKKTNKTKKIKKGRKTRRF
jgi:hypothetical protein